MWALFASYCTRALGFEERVKWDAEGASRGGRASPKLGATRFGGSILVSHRVMRRLGQIDSIWVYTPKVTRLAQPSKSLIAFTYADGTVFAPSARNSSFLLTPVNTANVPPSFPSMPN